MKSYIPHVKRRNSYQHVSDFDRVRIVSYRDYSLSYRSIAARVARDSMTVCRMWNQRVQEDHTKRPAGFKQLPTSNSREDRHLTLMALMDRMPRHKP